MGRKRRYRDAAVLGVYCVLTLVLTWPLVPQMTTRLAGDDVDVLINPWADWWTRKAITEDLDLYYTDYLFYPRGTSLVFHSFSHVNTAISLLLTPLIGTFAAYNVPILLAYVLSGFGMYLLVRHLTDCDFAGFVAGVVFAFSPYHMFESSHPVLVTTQFMPLFALSLLRVLYDDGDNHRARIGQVLLAALWFVLTALSSWHLMVMLASWTFLYLVYSWLSERDSWAPGASRYLILLACFIALAVLPFIWPILREQLTVDATYMTVPVEEGRGNDVLSFFISNRLHPILGPLFLEINSRIGYTRNWPAYLGYVALALAAAGVVTARRKTRFWWVTASVFLILSLGAQVKWEGVPFFPFYLPWAIPIISVLRHPLRLNTLLFFSLAVLVGFGGRWLWERLLSRNRIRACLALVSVTGFLLFEYWVYPFPTTQPSYSPFLHQLAEEDGDFAVVDFPMDRQAAKYYMYYQTIHGKKIVGGVVSRTPFDADAFVDASPLLSAIRNENVPPQYLEERLAVLAALDVRYIIIHKRFLDSNRMANWQTWLSSFPEPLYEDEGVIVFRTIPSLKTELLEDTDLQRIDAHLGDHIFLRGYRLSGNTLSPGGALVLTLFWQSDSRLAEDYHVFVHLLDADGQLVAQHDGVPVSGERPTWTWQDGEVIPDEHILSLGERLPGGTRLLSVGMYDSRTGLRLPVVETSGEPAPDDRILLQEVKVISQ